MVLLPLGLNIMGTRANLIRTSFFFASPITESTDSGSASVKKEKEKKNRKKDKENGSGSGEAGNQDNVDAPQAVVGFSPSPIELFDQTGSDSQILSF